MNDNSKEADEQNNIPINASLMEKLQKLQINAEDNGKYTILVTNNESIPAQRLSFSGKSNIIVQLIGEGEKIISFEGNGSLFTVESGITLILENGITLQGNSINNERLVEVNGTLIMNVGAKIIGNNGGGVSVNKNGSFTMEGGEISNNEVNSTIIGGGGIYVERNGSFTMKGGKISRNRTNTAFGGGGLCVLGSFTMEGGEISGNVAGPDCMGGGGVYSAESFVMKGGGIFGNVAVEGGGGVMIRKGSFTKTGGIIYGHTGDDNANMVAKGSCRGYVACVLSDENTSFSNDGYSYRTIVRYRDSTAGLGVTLNSSLSNGWEGGTAIGSAKSEYNSGCYIATAIYGSYDTPEVLCLRQFRDEILSQSIFGRLFITLYYRLSPPIAERLKNTQRINIFVRKALDKIVERLNKKFHNQNCLRV